MLLGGFNKIFHGAKAMLIQKVVETGGAVVSEYSENISPQKFTFLARNRLIAAHSDATIVVEASYKSGALNTASFARKYGKKVFSVPWAINYSNGVGNLSLFNFGASPIISYKDILKYYNQLTDTNLFDLSKGKKIVKAASYQIPKEYLPYYLFIKSNSPTYIDSIYERFNEVPIQEINTTLMLMEINDYITSINDELFIK